MDSTTGSGLMEEYDLMKQSKYRVYMSNIDKALKNFEYSSEWADLISALGKLNKVISSNAQYQIIPRRIKISKRLAQCMHPALPSGVHLKALESYDVIFSNIGVERLASELFIYSAGLFPLLGYSAMNVRPALLSIYEKYFVPLGEKLRPALSGFLSGVFPGLEAGQDHFERTNQLLDKVCIAVQLECFYTCLWECIVTNASVRLPAITYVLERYDKKLPCAVQRELTGNSEELMVNGLCSCLNDAIILVQRNTLEFLLLAFPMHDSLLTERYTTRLVKTALNTILRRDMSLNRRLYSWLLGSDTSLGKHLHQGGHSKEAELYDPNTYFEQYAKRRLIAAFKMVLKESITHTPFDLSPYRILISLLDKAEIGLRILDDVLCDIIRAISLCNGNLEVQKSANLLFSTFDPAYIWTYMSHMYREAATRTIRQRIDIDLIRIDSGPPSTVEVCQLTEFLLETLSLEMYNETTRVHLPKFLLSLISMFTMYESNMHSVEVAASLRLCVKIVSKIQPMIMSEKVFDLSMSRSVNESLRNGENQLAEVKETSINLEKSSSDSKIHESSLQVTVPKGAFQRSSSSQGLHKKGSGGSGSSGKYSKKSKKSKSYSKLSELNSSREGSLKCSKTKINQSDADLKICGASSTPDLKNGAGATNFNKPAGNSGIPDETTDDRKRFSCSSNSSTSSSSSSNSSSYNSSANTSRSGSSNGNVVEETAVVTAGGIVIQVQPSEGNAVGAGAFTIAELPDCPILDRCIRQYVAFFELYVCRKLLFQSDGSSMEQVSLQENLSIDGTNDSTNAGPSNDQDLVVINTLASELEEIFETLSINHQSSRAKLTAMLARSVERRSVPPSSDSRGTRKDPSGGKQEFEIMQLVRNNEILARVTRTPICESLRNALKLACNVLTEMSSFPSYRNESGATERIDDVPGWLKALALLAIFVSDLDTQLSAAQTLIDMIGLLRTNGKKSTKETGSGKTIVLMMPLLKLSHVNYLERRTKVFQVLTTMLWNYLEASRVEARNISQLLYRIHNCLDSRFTENVIIDRLLVPQTLYVDNDSAEEHYRSVVDRTIRRKDSSALHALWQIPVLAKTELKIDSDGLRKFQLLWKLGRETYHGNEFEKLLFLVLDSLTLPRNVSIQVKTANWLREALVRGDIGRILKLLLKTLLNESTKRLSIFCPKRLRDIGGTKEGQEDASASGDWEKELLVDADVQLNQACFAVSSEDGQIRYHMDPVAGLSKKRSPIRSIQKKIFGVSIGGSGSGSGNSKGSDRGRAGTPGNGGQLIVSNYVASESAGKKMHSTCLTSASGDDGGQYGKISVIINPLESEQLTTARVMRNRSNSMGLLAAAAIDLDSGISEPNSLAATGSSGGSHFKKEFHRSTSDLDDTNDSETDLRNGILGRGKQRISRILRGSEGYGDSEPIKRYVEEGPIIDFVSKSSDRFRNRKTYLISSGNISGAGAGEDSLFSGSTYTLTNGPSPSLNGTITTDEITNEDGSITMTTTATAMDDASEERKTSVGDYGSEEDKTAPKVTFTRINSWRNGSKLYPFHTHFLVYESVFNTKQILYTIETLRNILANDARFFLCLSVTTSVSSGQIKSLLLRHRRNIFGKGFTEARDDSEHQNLYRGCMYLEVILTVLLYYTRSYQTDQGKDSKGRQPSRDDFNTNAKIQLECIELMTTIFGELLAVVKDVGKNLANYVADLMDKCKVQKIVLYCLASSVNYFTTPGGYTCPADEVLRYSDPESTRQNAEAYQIELLRLLLAIVKLEHEITLQRADSGNEGIGSKSTGPTEAGASSNSSPTRVAPETKRTYRYIPSQLLAQQPMFLSTILAALECDRLQHVHKNWTDMVTACLTCLPPANLTKIVISVIHQLCSNLDLVTKRERILVQSVDYIVSQLEATTVLAHYCLLDSSQQISLASIFNSSAASNGSLGAPSSNQSGQIINNIVNVFLSYSSSLLSGGINQQVKKSHQEVAKNAILSHLPRIIITIATLWETSISDFRRVKHQLLEFLSPISMHYGTNFLAAIAVAWHERSNGVGGGVGVGNSESGTAGSSGSDTLEVDFFDIMLKALPQAGENQLLLVKLITGIRIMSVDSFIQTMHQVIKNPPPIYQPPVGLNLEVSALELLYFFLISGVSPAQYTDCWSSLYALLKDCLTLQLTAQFVALSILNEFVQRCPSMPFSDKKDLRDLHDVTCRLVEAVSNVAGSCLEQTTWLRRNLSVKEEFNSIESTGKDGLLMPSNQHYSIQAQSILATILASLLDVAFSSQEKDKVTTIVTGVMYNIVPYLKTHSVKNIPTFHACSNLLASLSTYQYIRKAWRKDALDLLLDSSFFQMDRRCLPYWKTILDSLMTCDNTTFRDLMNRLPLAQTGTLNIFTSKEQEYEQRALLLKRLAFVIFCSEVDQYHKYMPEIQEQLANSLRLPQVVPLIQSAVFLCFRVLLLRMSADHVTSLWPIIIAEMVQVFLSIEQELMTDTEEFSHHIRMLSGLDTAWVTNTSNGLYSHGHPHWRMVQLETAKLLELGCVLPATILPHFQMYRWAFVSSQNENFHKTGGYDEKKMAFIPHVSRISQLMDLRYTSHSPKTQTTKGNHIMLTCQSINTLQDLYGFFSTLSMRWPSHISYSDTEKDTKQCLEEVEYVLALDFLEKIPPTK
uniref:Dopey N-terminal domain-containing protein n=1 Tax=Anopheles atroparvus TaxID=41427 RepID=A0AAG5DBM9_ANOAO